MSVCQLCSLSVPPLAFSPDGQILGIRVYLEYLVSHLPKSRDAIDLGPCDCSACLKLSSDWCDCYHAAGKKKNVNVGNKGGTAGLDDYQYDAPMDDDYDFM